MIYKITDLELYKEYLLKKLKDGYILETSDIETLIEYSKVELEEYKERLDTYNLDIANIYNKKTTQTNKVNNKIANDFRKEIVDQCCSYLLGNPLTTTAEDKNSNEIINKILKYNDFELLDYENMQKMGAVGVSYRLIYIDNFGEISMRNIEAHNIIAITENDIVQYALHFYKELDNNLNSINVVDFYTETSIYKFKTKVDKLQNFVLEEVMEHTFNKCPIVLYANDQHKHTDTYNIETMINAYDINISNMQDELEENRLAYMVFEDAKIDEKVIQQAKQTGAFSIPAGAKVYFITKDINIDAYKEQKDTLKNNIYQFSSSLNVQEFISSNQSGESRKMMLILLDAKSKQKSNLIKKSLRNMWEIIAGALEKKNIKIDVYSLTFTFNPSLPQELGYIGDVLGKYKGLVSDETLRAQVPFVQDVEAENKKIKKQEAKNL